MRVEITPPEITDPKLAAEATREKLKRENDAATHDFRLAAVTQTLKDIRAGYSDLAADLAPVWAAVDAL